MGDSTRRQKPLDNTAPGIPGIALYMQTVKDLVCHCDLSDLCIIIFFINFFEKITIYVECMWKLTVEVHIQ